MQFVDHPIAYFLTIRTYGTWLPGDDRGWVAKHNAVFGTPFRGPEPRLRVAVERGLKHAPVAFATRDRLIVDAAMRETCVYRTWQLHTINVRTNHAHIVVSSPGLPEPVMQGLKAWSTRRLRQDGCFAPEVRIWSRHGSTIYLWNEQQLARACQYVNEYQDE